MRLIPAVLCAAGLSACITVATPGPPVPPVVSAAFWRAAPECVVVLPAGAAGEVGARAAERAFARHLFGRFDSVIGPDRRDADTRSLALDLRHPGDRAHYARASGCRHGAELAVAGGRSFAVIWADASLDLEARLLDLRTGDIIWSARHRASRGSGGLPTTPLGFLVVVGQAGAFAADADLVPSVLDDGLRALVATLPDIRCPSRPASGGNGCGTRPGGT